MRDEEEVFQGSAARQQKVAQPKVIPSSKNKLTTKGAKDAKDMASFPCQLRVLRGVRSHPLVGLIFFARWYEMRARGPAKED